VFAGMLGVTLFGLVLTPIFYVGIRKLGAKREQPLPAAEAEAAAAHPAPSAG
jgi:hypothetical protein